jgi:multisubunit Na+/H+ antiporter MnhF subunit
MPVTELIDIALVLGAAVAVLLGAVRAVMGPGMVDRVIALDMLTVAGVAVAALAARVTGAPAFLDVALGIALLGFIATIAFARMVERLPPDGGDEEGSVP